MSEDGPTVQQWIAERRNANTVYFKDKIRKIDAIIVFKRDKFSPKLETFLWNLRGVGLHLEFAPSLSDSNVYFAKVHAPDEILLKYAKLYEIHLKKDETLKFAQPKVYFKFLENVLNSPRPDPKNPDSKRAWKTISKEQPTDITFCERNVIVFAIMEYTYFSDDDFDVGIKQLISKDLVCDAFPLHDGPWEWPKDPNEPLNDRQLLAKYWASMSTMCKQQPLFVVEKYFGYEIATYFAWLGFYNKMLIYASFIGVFTFFCGVLFVRKNHMFFINLYCAQTPVRYHCAEQNTWQLMKFSDYCYQAHVANYNSNLITFIYSWLMIIWCTVFNEMWKRKLHVYDAKWAKTESEDFNLRPQFLASAKYVRVHKYTGKPELYITLGEKILRYTCSIFCTSLMICVVIISIASIIYLESFLKSIYMNRLLIIFISTCLSVLFMSILERYAFDYWIKILTKMELPRTELDYEKSYLVKSCIYGIINKYGRLFYVAFLKGRFAIPTPSLSQMCLLPGCIFEVVFTMIMMTLIKPFIDNFLEVQKPLYFLVARKVFRGTIDLENQPRWEREYVSNELTNVLSELEEMFIQYGVVACFAACFPLAPIFSLMHNLMEIKVDAMKILKYHKRPVSKKQITSIKIWFDIFETMTYVVIIVNAFFMAYTCNTTYLLYDFLIVENKKSFFDYMYYPANSCLIASPSSVRTTHERKAFQAGFALFAIILGFIVASILSYFIPDEPRSLREYLHQHERKRKRK